MGIWGPICWTPLRGSGFLPSVCNTPMHSMLPCISVYSRWYLGVLRARHFLCWGLGASAHLSGFWYLSGHLLDVHYASSCAFLVVYYVSSLYYHGYDYYSSSDCGVFWYVISIISDCGSLFDGASYNIGSAWCGSATTPDTKMLWRCSWPCLCATAATSILNASSDLCQLCHGFSTGRFLFQSWKSHQICILYVWFLF